MFDFIQPYFDWFTTTACVLWLAYYMIITARKPFRNREPWALFWAWVFATVICPIGAIFQIGGKPLEYRVLVYVATLAFYLVWLGALFAVYVALRYGIISARIMQITRQVQRQTNGTGKIDWSCAYELAAVAPASFWRPVLWKYIDSRA